MRSAASRNLAALKAQGRRRRAIFAEALAEGATVKEAAARAGVCAQRGSQFLAEIRRQLGWQAV